jgi:hypothetical protein
MLWRAQRVLPGAALTITDSSGLDTTILTHLCPLTHAGTDGKNADEF